MNKIIYDKRGGEKVLSIWEIFVLIIIIGGMVIGVLIFYSAEIDVRDAEANYLYKKIASCLNENGVALNEYFNNDFDIFEYCELNRNIFTDMGEFYFEVSLKDENGNDLREEIFYGNPTFRDTCIIEEGINSGFTKSGKCFKRTEVTKVINNENGEVRKGFFEFITASNNKGDRVQNVAI